MFRERTGAHEEILASWGNYKAVVDNSTCYFKKLNIGLKDAYTGPRWCVIKNKYSNSFITKGIFSPITADTLFRKIGWDSFNRSFIFPDNVHKVTEIPETGERVFSTEVWKCDVDGLIKMTDTLSFISESEGSVTYEINLNLIEKISARQFAEKPIHIDVRKIPGDSLCVWFDLRIAVSK